MQLKIVADENIARLDVFENFGQVVKKRGRFISKEDLKKADILLVRSVTKVNKELLEDTPVKFVGSATAGIEHVDVRYLKENKITFACASRSNANAVVDYVICALLTLAENYDFDIRNKIVGIVGVGNIGSILATRLRMLKVNCLLCDPPLQAKYPYKENWVSFNEVIKKADIISLHTPLIVKGPYATYHMIDNIHFKNLKKDVILINASRGQVINNLDLLLFLKENKNAKAVLDVWENEPNISLDLLKITTLATAHIAGYSVEAKLAGTAMIFNSLASFLKSEKSISAKELLQEDRYILELKTNTFDQRLYKDCMDYIYDINKDNNFFKENPLSFDDIRKNYNCRREVSAIRVKTKDDLTDLFKGLGFTVL